MVALLLVIVPVRRPRPLGIKNAGPVGLTRVRLGDGLFNVSMSVLLLDSFALEPVSDLTSGNWTYPMSRNSLMRVLVSKASHIALVMSTHERPYSLASSHSYQ
jgi:hypothetical protein